MTQNKTLTDNEAFEKWFDANRELYDDNSTYDLMQIAWVAAKHESAKEIAELKEQVHNLNWALGTDGYEQMATVEQQLEFKKGVELIDSRIADMKHRKDKITELQSQVDMLREALRGIKSFAIKYSDKNNDIDYLKAFMKVINNSEKALSATAKQSLIEHDNEVLERAAKVANGLHDCDIIADAIRELKEVKL